MSAGSKQPRTPSDEIAGLVERVTFFNEKSGLAVLRVRVWEQPSIKFSAGRSQRVHWPDCYPSLWAGFGLTYLQFESRR